jgi:type II secretory pathway pseudopilin PulG
MKQKGFFLVEVVVAASIIATVLMLLLGSISNSVEASQRSLERTQASYLLEEGAEAVRSIRDTSWATIAALTNGTTYYLSWSGTAWSLTTTPSTVDAFTRTVVLSAVSRDSTDDIVESGGTLDTDTRKVVITTTWSAQSASRSENVSLYLTNIR